MLTTCSLLFTILSAYLFVIDYRVWAAFFYKEVITLTVPFNYVEHIKWVSQFGDLYDHITDFIKVAIFIVLLYTEYNDKI